MENATRPSGSAAAIRSKIPNERGWAQIEIESSPADGAANTNSRPRDPALLRSGRLDVGDLEAVGKRWAQRQAGFIAMGHGDSCAEPRQRGDALKTFIGQRQRAIRHGFLAQWAVAEQTGERDQEDRYGHRPRRALPRPECGLEAHVFADRIIATVLLAHENGRA